LAGAAAKPPKTTMCRRIGDCGHRVLRRDIGRNSYAAAVFWQRYPASGSIDRNNARPPSARLREGTCLRPTVFARTTTPAAAHASFRGAGTHVRTHDRESDPLHTVLEADIG